MSFEIKIATSCRWQSWHMKIEQLAHASGSRVWLQGNEGKQLTFQDSGDLSFSCMCAARGGGSNEGTE